MRVVIAEDDTLLREGLALVLRSEGIDVVGTTGDAAELVALVERTDATLAICDVRMPPTMTDEGLRAAIEARRRFPGLATLVLSAYVEPRYAGELLADGAGAAGYLLKERVGAVAEFLDVVHRVAGGETVLDPEVVARLMRHHYGRSPIDRLTPREREVLELMAQGYRNGAIAERLYVTETAVNKHVRSIFNRLGLHPDDAGHRRVLAVLAYLRGH